MYPSLIGIKPNQFFSYSIRIMEALTDSTAIGMSNLAQAAEPPIQFKNVEKVVGRSSIDESGVFKHIEVTITRLLELPKTESGADQIQKLAVASLTLQTTGVLLLIVIKLQLTSGATTADEIARLSRRMAQLQIEILPENHVLYISSGEGTVGVTSAVSAHDSDLEKRMDVSHRFISFLLLVELNCVFAELGQRPKKLTLMTASPLQTLGMESQLEVGNGPVNSYELQFSTDPAFTTYTNVVGVVGTSVTIGGIGSKTTMSVRIADFDRREPRRLSSSTKTVTFARFKSIQGRASGKPKGAK